MQDYFAAVPLSNASLLCVGGITRGETEKAAEDGMLIDGFGYYLFLARQSDPTRPIEILAKFATEAAAERLVRLMSVAHPLAA